MVLKVSDVLVAGAVVAGATWATFDATVAGLVDQLVSAGRLRRELAAAAARHVVQREAVASTGMVDIGIGIPHARLEGINGIVAAMAVSPGGVYQVADGLPISIVTLVLSSPALSGEHLNFLSVLSMLLQSASLRERLRNASSADQILQLVRSNELARR